MVTESSYWDRRRFLVTSATGIALAFAGCTSDETGGGGGDGSDGGDGGTDGDGESGGSDGSDGTDDGGDEAGTQTASAMVGEIVEDGSIQMVVRETRTTNSIGEFQEADAGNTFLIVRMAVKNISDDFVNFSGFWQARVKDSSNHVYDASFTVTEHPLGSELLASGEVARGDMVFEVPTSASGFRLQFDFETFSLFDYDRVTITLSEKASPIADLSQSLNIDILSPGDMASQGDVTVTLHGVRTTEEVGEYTQAAEGNEFVITDIEIANESDEPLAVSSLLQMALKDGRGFTYGSALGATSQLDQKYSEGSEISPGESRRGELAYEIATDVDTIYWMFNFLDFNADHKAFWQMR